MKSLARSALLAFVSPLTLIKNQDAHDFYIYWMWTFWRKVYPLFHRPLTSIITTADPRTLPPPEPTPLDQQTANTKFCTLNQGCSSSPSCSTYAVFRSSSTNSPSSKLSFAKRYALRFSGGGTRMRGSQGERESPRRSVGKEVSRFCNQGQGTIASYQAISLTPSTRDCRSRGMTLLHPRSCRRSSVNQL